LRKPVITEGQTGESRVKICAIVIRYGFGPDDVQKPFSAGRYAKQGTAVAVCNCRGDGLFIKLQVCQLHERTGQSPPFKNDMNGKHPLLAEGVRIAFGHNLQAQADRARRARVRTSRRGADLEKRFRPSAIEFSARPIVRACTDPSRQNRCQSFVPNMIVEADGRQILHGVVGVHRQNMDTGAGKGGQKIEVPALRPKPGAIIDPSVRAGPCKRDDSFRFAVPAPARVAMPDQDQDRDGRAGGGVENPRLNPDVMRKRARSDAQQSEQAPSFHARKILSQNGFAAVVSGLALLFLFAATPAYAHSDTGSAGGLVAGFLHPFRGYDHLLAMVSVGIWGAFLGRPLLIVLPSLFPMLMAAGAVLAINSVPFPPVEIGIAASLLVLGGMIACAIRTSTALAILIVGGFGLFHGYAHGAELPFEANPIAYTIGFVIATGLLHLAGIGLGYARRIAHGETALRLGGAAVAIAGLWFLGRTIMP
jgi:urease accessory protein